MGRLDQAIEELRQAEALDPLSLVIRSALADELSCAGRTDEALNIIRQVLTMDPNFPKGRLVLGSIYARSRRYAEAISAFEKAQEIGGEPIELLGWTSYVYTLTGNRAAAESAVRRIQELYALHHEPAPASVKASMYLGLGDNDRAFRWLQRACKGHEDARNYLKTAPEFDPLRADPRFKDLLRCVGLPT